MGFYSQLALTGIDRRAHHDSYLPPKQARRDLLEYHLLSLQGKLKSLDETRAHNPMDALFDTHFYSNEVRHYNEDPQTAQDILRAFSEVKELLWNLDCYEQDLKLEKRKEKDAALLAEVLPTQVLITCFWEFAFLFHEAEKYKQALPVMTL